MRGIVKFLLTLIVILVFAWLGLWWYAQGRLQNGFNNWAAARAAQGWKISYGAIHRGSSPLRAVVSFDNLTVSPPPGRNGDVATMSLPSFALRIEAANPLLLHNDVPNKISISVSGLNTDAAFNFGSIASTVALDPNALFSQGESPVRGGDLAASNIDILASQGSLLVLHIDNLAAHYAVNRQATAGQWAYNGSASMDGIALSPLLTRIASIPFNGKITHLDYALQLSGPVPDGLQTLPAQVQAAKGDKIAEQKLIIPVLHKWAAQGGNGNLSLHLTIGPSTASADAAVKFDANLQPGGTANLTADHLDAFTAAVTNAYPQAQGRIDQAMAQLTPYITTTDQGGQTLGLHVTYGPGAVNINGNKVAGQPKVDWNALENPPPPPPTAPGDGSGAASSTP